MDTNEIIEILHYIAENGTTVGLSKEQTFNIKEAINYAIEALKRQKPMRAIENYNWCDLSEEGQKENCQWFCPNCNATVEESYGYCVNCGQKIDWEEE